MPFNNFGNILNERYSHTLQHCFSINLSKNVIQWSELKVNKMHVGHLGKYPPFSRSLLISHSCIIYRTKGIPMPYNIAVALPHRKMRFNGLNWRKTKYMSAILEKWPSWKISAILRYLFITHRCVVYQMKGIFVLYNIVVASPYRKMWSKGRNWRETKYASAILENIRHFQDMYLSHIDV